MIKCFFLFLIYPKMAEIKSIDTKSAQSKTQNHCHAPFVTARPVAWNILEETTRAETQHVSGHRTVRFVKSA